jgi:O-antigen ligase
MAARKVVKARSGLGVNAMLGIGLWTLLWLGYNTGPGAVIQPDFPRDTTDLIQGLRAFLPILGGWLALIVIFLRIHQLPYWMAGPLGGVFMYGAVGTASSALSIQPYDEIYWGLMYLSIVLCLLAISSVENPLTDLRQLLSFTWIVGTMFTLGLLAALPYFGGAAMTEDIGPTGVRAYVATGEIMGMATTRNTGFARYAAVSGLVGLARLTQGKRYVRIAWAGVFLASVYALIISNGRTEILAFLLSAILVFAVQKGKRVIFLIAGLCGAGLLTLTGFYGDFFLYITRTGHVDTSMTGRIVIWARGWELFLRSPATGLGFQADRFYLAWQHMHNAFLHALVQAGILGAAPLYIALVAVWRLIIKHFVSRQPRDKSLIPPEIPAVLLFITISSITESTFAYYSATWMLSAPIFAYVVALDRHLKESSAKAAWYKKTQDASSQTKLDGPRGPRRGNGVPFSSDSWGPAMSRRLGWYRIQTGQPRAVTVRDS